MDTLPLARYLDYAKFRHVLREATTQRQLYQKIVDTPFEERLAAALLGLGICVLLLRNTDTNTIDRIALSRTEQAEGSKKRSAKRFEEIKIPADYSPNILVKAIQTGEPQITSDWKYMFIPDLTPAQARMNQASAGIGCSVVYPLQAGDGGAMIFSYFISADQITPLHHEFMKTYARSVSKSLQRFL